MASSEFSARKEFTLNKQIQGELNPYLSRLFEMLTKQDTTQWHYVSLVYPVPSVMERVSSEWKTKFKNVWRTFMNLCVPFMHEQWITGVRSCVSNDMMVPRRGADIDSTGWNLVVGAWNNALRQLRALDDEPRALKCIKLTAADQMNWAVATRKGIDKNVAVFSDLVENDILPWTNLGASQSAWDAIQVRVRDVCLSRGMNVLKWLGKPRERTEARTKEHNDMICGVKTATIFGPLTTVDATALKALGVFGATTQLRAAASAAAGAPLDAPLDIPLDIPLDDNDTVLVSKPMKEMEEDDSKATPPTDRHGCNVQ